MIDRFLRAIGIAQGAHWLWLTLGGSAVLTAIVAGALTVGSQLPLWIVVLAATGTLLIAIGTLNALAQTISGRLVPRGEAYHALTRVIEDGRRLRERLSKVDADPSPTDEIAWNVRITDWTDEADAAVASVAPFRLAAFRMDVLITDFPGKRDGRPNQVAKWELDVETTLERLLYIRVTL